MGILKKLNKLQEQEEIIKFYAIENFNKKTTITTLEGEKADLKKENEELKKENEELKKELEVLKNDRETTRAKHNTRKPSTSKRGSKQRKKIQPNT